MIDIANLDALFFLMSKIVIIFVVGFFIPRFIFKLYRNILHGDDNENKKKKVDLTKHKKPKASETDYSNYIGFHHNNIAK